MRILQVVHQFLPEYVGGTEVYVADLARRLRARGHEVAIFAGGDAPGQGAWDGLEVTRVPGGTRSPAGPVATFLATFHNPRAERVFLQTLARLQPQVVHFHHLLGLSTRLPALAKGAGAATCFTLHDYWFLCPKSQLLDYRGGLCQGPVLGLNCGVCAAERLGSLALAAGAPLVAPLFLLRQRRVRRAIATADVLFAPSRFLAQVAWRSGLPRERTVLVDFGLEESGDSPPQKDPRAPGDPLRVTYLGAIAPSKGVHVLVEACRLLVLSEAEGLAHEPVSVRIYGDLAAYPDYGASLRRRAQGLGIRFMGAAAREQVPALLAETDVLVVPSLWYENAPLVVTEAFAAGVPVVASRVGALQEKVRDGVDGLLFPMGDAAALAGLLRQLAATPQLLERLRPQVRPQATRERHLDHMEQEYRALIAGASLVEQGR